MLDATNVFYNVLWMTWNSYIMREIVSRGPWKMLMKVSVLGPLREAATQTNSVTFFRIFSENNFLVKYQNTCSILCWNLIVKTLIGSNIGLNLLTEMILDVMRLKKWLASVLLLTLAMLITTLGNLYNDTSLYFSCFLYLSHFGTL